MSSKTATLGSGDHATTIGKIGHGLMYLTWCPEPVSDEVAFEAIKTSLDSVPPGVKMMLNSGEFYGNTPREANLELLARFFEKYPKYTDKAFISVKGCVDFSAHPAAPDGSPEGVKRSVENSISKLRGTKKLDLFQCARVDRKTPIEETIKTLAGYVSEGKIDHIGMSECKAETLRRAHAVHPISVVEIEVSPWSHEDETKKVIAATKELGIVVAAYSPLGRGFLTGKIKRVDDLHPKDGRRMFTRFKDENMQHNFAIVDGLSAIAEKKGITPAQLCLAWVSSLGPHVVPIPGSSHKSRTEENLAARDINLTGEDLAAIDKLLADNKVKGDRYWGQTDEEMNLWG